jgi:hypothetical protein
MDHGIRPSHVVGRKSGIVLRDVRLTLCKHDENLPSPRTRQRETGTTTAHRTPRLVSTPALPGAASAWSIWAAEQGAVSFMA